MKYDIEKHGDILEKEAAAFIRQDFYNYELVWQIYIGNIGNASKAMLPNYPYEEKRIIFSENSYTVLESIYLINKIIDSKIFTNSINSFSDYFELNKSFISVFALLGRLHDTVIKASNSLKYDNTKFIESIHSFYEARNIVIHGKKVPLVFDDLGLPLIPFLKTSKVDGEAWHDTYSSWSDINDMPLKYINDSIKDFKDELIKLINSEYAVFLDIISAELKKFSTSLVFQYSSGLMRNHLLEASGSICTTTTTKSFGINQYLSNNEDKSN